MKAPSPIAETFAVFESPYNLARITPTSLKFRITTKERVTIRKGAEIEYQLRWLGLPISWRTIFTEYEPPLFFEDEQAEGPYALWRHRHSFEEVEDGTVISDRVEYALPLGALGRLAEQLVVGRQLRGIFQYRQRALIQLLGGDASLYGLSPSDIVEQASSLQCPLSSGHVFGDTAITSASAEAIPSLPPGIEIPLGHGTHRKTAYSASGRSGTVKSPFAQPARTLCPAHRKPKIHPRSAEDRCSASLPSSWPFQRS